ncbi:GTP-binding protein [Parasporobacterium paucivorans]|uniref:CobW/HypB/UreG, nucleotide-binding domain n=1 Tax=Parasporobacterium paucivorans DSM 15970 TaxID=1122934 RepID=A0A1M6IKI8_9FIRM|nr:GTP-binding protein [Parasporobacterium paucivorans]SHJ34929.1 CobW/HypB/UreG, nucleotide-binding domain [Parasporobacterium paucivorans DSM 15970]
MKILMFGGFLGSGKTTIIKPLIQELLNKGDKVALIENEIGETGIDQNILEEAGVHITTISGGCICCQLTGNLIDAFIKIKEDLSPDWLIVETTGLAVMKSIVDSYKKYGDPDIPIYTFAVVDVSRWDVLVRAMENLLRAQLEGVNGVLLNKTDIKDPTEDALKRVAEYSGNAPTYMVSSTSCSSGEILEIIESALKQGAAKEDK